MFCSILKEFLSQNKVNFNEFDVTKDKNAMAELKRLGYMTTPVTVIEGEAVVGFDRSKLARLLEIEIE